LAAAHADISSRHVSRPTSGDTVLATPLAPSLLFRELRRGQHDESDSLNISRESAMAVPTAAALAALQPHEPEPAARTERWPHGVAIAGAFTAPPKHSRSMLPDSHRRDGSEASNSIAEAAARALSVHHRTSNPNHSVSHHASSAKIGAPISALESTVYESTARDADSSLDANRPTFSAVANPVNEDRVSARAVPATVSATRLQRSEAASPRGTVMFATKPPG
jgi:hypothetical protein